MKLMLVILSALLIALPLSFPGLYFLAWLAFIPILLVLRQTKSLKKSFFWGWLFGFFLYAGASYWLYFPINDFSGLPFPLVILLTLLLFGVAGITRGIWAVIFKLTSGSKGESLLALLTSWLVVEYLLMQIFPYFPFGSLALTQIDFNPFLQLAEIGGMYLIILLVLLLNALIFKTISRQKVGYIFLALLVVLGSNFAAGHQLDLLEERRAEVEETLDVGVLRTEIPQEDKWSTENIEANLLDVAQLSNEAYTEGAELVVMPETALTFDYPRNSYYRDMFHDELEQEGHIVVGSQAIDEEPEQSYNSVFLVDETKEITGRYNKRILVPGGEKVPFPALQEFFTGESWQSLAAGEENQILELPENISFQPLICSEILYAPREVAELVDHQFMINPSNEAWFGESNLQNQMWQSARLRAVETRMSVLKAGNKAFSGKVYPDGSYEKTEEAEVFAVSLLPEGREGTYYQQFGDYPVYLSLILLFIVIPVIKLLQNSPS